MRVDLRSTIPATRVAQLWMLPNLLRAYDERDYETLAVLAPEGARDLAPRWPPLTGATVSGLEPRWRLCAAGRAGRRG